MAAKVRPALLLTGEPADDELDVVSVLLLECFAITKPTADKCEWRSLERICMPFARFHLMSGNRVQHISNA